MNTSSFLQILEKTYYPGFFTTDKHDLAHFGVDWGGILTPNPLAIVFPKNTEEVSSFLKLCSANNINVVPSGGRTGLSGGATASNGEVVLSVSKINSINEVDVSSLTIRVGAGAVTQNVHERAAKHNLIWPVDFAAKGSSQIGGNIATNAGGVRVIRYGNARSWVLSIKAVLMSGDVIEFNGDLEKNNTGYDLRHLLIGSEGTLAVITEATLKLCPKPENLSVCFFGLEDMHSVVRLFSECRKAFFQISAFECLTDVCLQSSLAFTGLNSPLETKCPIYVLLEFEDQTRQPDQLEAWLSQVFESGLIKDGVLAQSPREFKELWQIRESTPESILTGRVVLQHDVSVPVSKLPDFSRSVLEKYKNDYPDFEVFVFGHIGDGNLHIFIRKPEALDTATFITRCRSSDTDLFDFVKKFTGSVSAEHGIGLLKKHALNYSRQENEVQLMRAIKKAFDPKNLLNPGKIF